MTQTKVERNTRIFLLHTVESQSMSEIGERFEISRERVRQILRKQGVLASVTRERRLQRERREGQCAYCGRGFNVVRSNKKIYCGHECRAEATRKYTHDGLVQYLRDMAERLGRTPTTKEVQAAGPPSLVIFQEYFGSYGRACVRAGLPVRKRGERLSERGRRA